MFQSHDTIFRLEELQTCFVACMRIDVTPLMAARSATVEMVVKWLLRESKFSYGTSSDNPVQEPSDFAEWNLSQQMLSCVVINFTVTVSCTPIGHC
jgi:hypothetical protein